MTASLFIPRSPRAKLPLYEGFTFHAVPTATQHLPVIIGSGATHTVRPETDEEYDRRRCYLVGARGPVR